MPMAAASIPALATQELAPTMPLLLLKQTGVLSRSPLGVGKSLDEYRHAMRKYELRFNNLSLRVDAIVESDHQNNFWYQGYYVRS